MSWTSGQQFLNQGTPTSSWGNPGSYNSWGNPGGYNSWGNPGGYDSSWGQQGGNGYTYTTKKPSDYGQLIDTGTTSAYGQMPMSYGGQPGPNTFWIVDMTGFNRYPSMSIPLYGYAKEEIIPSLEGYLTIEEMYPDGQVRTFNMGYVRPYQVYSMWFYADQPGTHLVRYSVNGYYSNTIRYYVQGTRPSSPYGGFTTGGTSMVRGGGTIVRGGGSTTVRTSGGSISISTSM